MTVLEAPSRQLGALPQTFDVIRRIVDEGLVPGAILAWQTDGGPVRYQAAGEILFQSGREVDDRSIFRIFSQTKPVTGIAAMMLIEDGAIGLDQPLGEILPDFSRMRVAIDNDFTNTRPAARPITIRHLLTHTAGLGAVSVPAIVELYMRHGIAPGQRQRVAGPGQAATPATLAEMGARLARLPLEADPGERFDYSVALDVLGLVIETVSGKPFDVFLKERIFDPLDMIDTGFSISPEQAGRFMALYQHHGPSWTFVDDPTNSAYARPGYPSGGGGLVSTARDYARFAAMLLNEGTLDGVRILKPETVRLARSNLLPEGVDHVDVPLGQTLAGAGFGAGMSVQVAPGRVTDGLFIWPGEVPTGVFGWPGAGGTACWIDPANRFFLLFMTQFWPMHINAMMRPEVIAAAYRDLAAAGG